MIIFGTTAKSKTIDRGHFHCPHCQTKREYELKEAKRYFTLYFIPVIPMDKLGQYIECQTCHTSFKPEVLKMKPEQRPRTVAELLNTVESRLRGGEPIELVLRDLTAAGIDRDVALRLVDAYLGPQRMQCSHCSLSYADNVTICAECGQSLTPVE